MAATHVLTCSNCRFPFTAANAYATACGPVCRRAAFRARDRSARMLAAAAFFEGV